MGPIRSEAAPRAAVATGVGDENEPSTWVQRHPAAVTWAPRIVPPLAYLILASYYFGRFLAHLGEQVPGGADGVIYAWFFQAVEQSVIHLHNPLFTAAMNAPDGVNVMWNTALVGLAVVSTPLTAIIGPVDTAVLMMALAPVVSATCAYYALRRITGSSWGSALAASLYGFGPFFVGQNGHLHLTFAFVPPLLLLAGWHLLVRQDGSPVRTGAWLGVLVGLGILVSEELVALTAIVAVCATALLAALNPRQVRARARHAVIGLGTAGVVTIAVAGYPLWYQFFGPQALTRGPVSRQRLDLAGLVRPSELQYYASSADIAANHSFPAVREENTGYLGWPPLILVIVIAVFLIARRDRMAPWWLATAVLTVWFSLGTPVTVNGTELGPGIWAIPHTVPLFETVVAVRFSLITTLLVALLLAYALSRVHGRVRAALTVLVVIALIPLRPYGQYDTQLRIETPRFFTTSAVNVIRPDTTVLILPRDQSPDGEATIMMWQLRAGQRFRIIGGYSVFSIGGQMSYIAPEPQFAQLLQHVGTRGAVPPAGEIAAARPSVAESGTRYLLLASGQPNASAVEQTAQELTGCTWQSVADVRLCAIP
jgi:hypothetical protein